MMKKGHAVWNPIFVAHFPFVPEEEGLSVSERLEDFFDLILHSYIPFFALIRRHSAEESSFSIGLSLSPSVLGLIKRDSFTRNLELYYFKLLSQIENQLHEATTLPFEKNLLNKRKQNLQELWRIFTQDFSSNLLEVLVDLCHRGSLDLIPSSATTIFFPHFRDMPEILQTQINLGISHFRDCFPSLETPEGFFLPECGFYPYLEDILEKSKTTYSFLESSAVLNGSQISPYSIYAPLKNHRTHFFINDPWVSQKIYGPHSYPWDPLYHAPESFRQYEIKRGERCFLHQYKSRWGDYSSDLQKNSESYTTKFAEDLAQKQAYDFVQEFYEHLEPVLDEMDRPFLVSSVFDLEVFGTLWHEGFLWLEKVFHLFSEHPKLSIVNANKYLSCFPESPSSVFSLSSLRFPLLEGLDFDDHLSWFFRYAYEAFYTLRSLVEYHKEGPFSQQRLRLLNQLVSEFLLLQSFDWWLLMGTKNYAEWAQSSFLEHLGNFHRIHEHILQQQGSFSALLQIEKKDDLLFHLPTFFSFLSSLSDS